MHLAIAGISFIVGSIIGMVIGYSSLDYTAKQELRKRLEGAKSGTLQQAHDEISPRGEERQKVPPTTAHIRAPILDSAGIPVENEEKKYDVELVGLSQKGASVISQHFFKLGLNVFIACRGERVAFDFRRAQIRNAALTDRGIRIGIEFFEPLREDEGVKK